MNRLKIYEKAPEYHEIQLKYFPFTLSCINFVFIFVLLITPFCTPIVLWFVVNQAVLSYVMRTYSSLNCTPRLLHSRHVRTLLLIIRLSRCQLLLNTDFLTTVCVLLSYSSDIPLLQRLQSQG
jgi:hypothetical protein